MTATLPEIGMAPLWEYLTFGDSDLKQRSTPTVEALSLLAQVSRHSRGGGSLRRTHLIIGLG